MSQQEPAGEPRSKKSKAEGEDEDMIQASSEEYEQFGDYDDGNPQKQPFAMMKAMLARQNTQKKRMTRIEHDVKRIDQRREKNEADIAAMQQQIRLLQHGRSRRSASWQ
eukprot:4701014-Pyramimonas_sp.AAC.1